MPIKKKTQNKENWLSTEAIILLGLIFICVQTLGVFVAKQLIQLGLQEPMFSPDINNINNAFYLFGTILIMTGIILILLKLRRTKKILWIIEALSIFMTSIIVFSTIFPTNDLIVLLLTITLLVIRYTNRENKIIRTIISMITIAGAGALIGISLGLIPIIAFIILLAIYDIIAVFYTKHMLEIGKEATKNNFAFMVAIPTKKHDFELGNGDLVIPLIVASSIIANGPFMNNGLIAGLILGASYTGLITSIYLVAEKKTPMPALPPQTILMVITLIISITLGF